MAVNGEERLLTLFADVHYYFQEPGPRPVQHRFDKESYVYLYRDVAHHRGRLEVANHAGSPEQDAFAGYLDNSRITQSHRHPTLVTVVVDGYGKAPAQQAAEHHWRLPSTDPRDEGKYLFRLHTLDMYFWTVEDAHSFVQSAQQALQAEQFDVDVPQVQHHDSMSPVVQNLENVAISDPAYQKTQSRDSRAGSTAAQVGSQTSPPPQGQQKEHNPAAFTPLAYNPSAPPPPEEIKHREKTPPPPEAADGTGLATAAFNDRAQQHYPQQYQNLPPPPVGMSPSPHQPYTGAPQPSTQSSQQHASTTSPIGPQTTTSPTPSASSTQRYIPSGIDPATYKQAQDVSQQPLDSPTAEILGGSIDSNGRRQPVGHLQPQYADYLGSRPSSISRSPVQTFVQSPPVVASQPQGTYQQQHSQAQQQQAYAQQQAANAQQQAANAQQQQAYAQQQAAYAQQQQAQAQQPPPYNPQQQHMQQHSQSHSFGQAQAQQPYWQANPYGTGDHALHGQVYVPDDNEAAPYGMKHGRSSTAISGGQQGMGRKLEQHGEKVEKGINRFLKKVEKKIG